MPDGGGVQRRAVRRRGPSTTSGPTRPAAPGAWPRRTAHAPRAPSARPPCRCTAAWGTRGIASSTSTCAVRCSPRSGSATTASSCASSSARVWESPMDLRDSPAEAEFRARFRAWLAENNPGLPVSSTDDEYWARQAEWHTALYDAGFFGLSWPSRFGGHDLPPVFDVILDEELAAAGAPPRPSLGYLVQGITTHGSDAIQERFLPGLISGRERWCQGFSEPDAGSDLAALRTTATRDGDEYVINGHKIWTSYSDVADWCFLLARTDPERAEAQGPLRLRGADASARDRAAPAAHDQRHHHGVRSGAVRRRARRRREHDRRAGRRLARRDDDRQPRTGARRARLRRALREDGQGARAGGARGSGRVPERPARSRRLGVRAGGDAAAARAAAGSPSVSTVSTTGPAARSTSS